MSPPAETAASRLRFTTREALFLGFCASFVVLARAALRWHLHLPGHSMAPTVFLLLLARTCVPRTGAATLVGGLAGLAAAGLGMGKGGPLLVVKLLLPGAVVDAAAWALPDPGRHVLSAALVGAAAGATRFASLALVELLIGVEPALILGHALVAGGAAAAFGALGGALVPPVARRLRAHGVIP